MQQRVTPLRERHIRGGLDNAARQAEARGLHKMLVIDADCHEREPFSLFSKYVRPSFRRSLLRWDAEANPWYTKIVTNRVKRPEVSYPRPMQPAEVVETFCQRMQEIGITKSVVLPDAMLGLATDRRNPDYEVEVGGAFTRYMVENFGHLYRNMLTTIYAPTSAPEKAAELIDDFGNERVICGVIVPAMTPTVPGSDAWNPIYDAAQRKRLPICVHGDNPVGEREERKGWLAGFQFDTFLANHVLSFPFTLARQITSIVLDGVPERFPNLKFAFMEGGVTYIPWLMQRLDDEYVKRRHEAPLLKKLPSAYMNEFYYTTQPLESAHQDVLKLFLSTFDYENHLVYASDYPHWDFDAPSTVYDLPFLSDAARKKILGENAARLFKIA